MTRPTLAILLGATALYLGVTVVPALIVRAALWTWHVPHIGIPIVLVALVGWCWLIARWLWRSA